MTWSEFCNKTKAECKVQLNSITCDCVQKDYHFDSDQGRCRIKSQCNDEVCGDGTKCTSIEDTYAIECNCIGKKQYYDYYKKKCSEIDKCLGIVCDAFKECKEGECKCMKELKENGTNCVLDEKICKNRYGKYAICNVKADSFGRPVYSVDCDKGYYFDPRSEKNVSKLKETIAKWEIRRVNKYVL
ncbi:uncharacterized protein [Centruroides vittatus]|uniref:uncharacterized protein n=1 Tax=Centruroides vittatus TaxID=120091 RepID=UPI003510292A